MNDSLLNKTFTHKVKYEIKISAIDKEIPVEFVPNFMEWLKSMAVSKGVGRQSHYYSYNDNYSDDISVVFYVKSIK